MKKYIISIILVFIIGIAGICYQLEREKSEETAVFQEDIKLNEEEGRQGAVQAEKQTVYVHVCGAVKKPGVYPMDAAARVSDLITAAGGLTKKAAADSINQARLLEDGEQVYIPTKKEWKMSGQACGQQAASGSGAAQERPVEGKSLVNINTADKEMLMTLTGIGESKAESIIAYREENGAFQSIEDLKNITGIKNGVFEKIKNQITV